MAIVCVCATECVTDEDSPRSVRDAIALRDEEKGSPNGELLREGGYHAGARQAQWHSSHYSRTCPIAANERFFRRRRRGGVGFGSVDGCVWLCGRGNVIATSIFLDP